MRAKARESMTFIFFFLFCLLLFVMCVSILACLTACANVNWMLDSFVVF